jgi:malonate-semialdehyde dehydrogenase (acetylating) / methylmalonate-semialdehyde dehydrogenase
MQQFHDSSLSHHPAHRPIVINTMLAGVLNVVQGSHSAVNQICDHPDLKAVAFVGSDGGGRHVYTRACAAGKRVQSNMGAKNHAVVLPDASKDHTLNALTGAAFGAAGQRCMAISAAVLVGEASAWEDSLVKFATGLKVWADHA